MKPIFEKYVYDKGKKNAKGVIMVNIYFSNSLNHFVIPNHRLASVACLD